MILFLNWWKYPKVEKNSERNEWINNCLLNKMKYSLLYVTYFSVSLEILIRSWTNIWLFFVALDSIIFIFKYYYSHDIDADDFYCFINDMINDEKIIALSLLYNFLQNIFPRRNYLVTVYWCILVCLNVCSYNFSFFFFLFKV